MCVCCHADVNTPSACLLLMWHALSCSARYASCDARAWRLHEGFCPGHLDLSGWKIGQNDLCNVGLSIAAADATPAASGDFRLPVRELLGRMSSANLGGFPWIEAMVKLFRRVSGCV